MTSIEQLIKEKCPNGVEYYYLSELEENKIIILGRGNVISKNDLGDYPGEFPVYSSSSVGDGEIGKYGKYMFDDIRISWSIDGGGKFFYRDAPKYSITNVSGWLKVLKEDIVNTKYLYYFLMNEWIKKVYDYSHKAHPSVIRKEYYIAIPPIEIQNKIVKILDKFSKLETELEIELETELEERHSQYEFWREKLFDNKYKEMKLQDVLTIKNGKDYKHLDSGDIPVYGSGGIMTYVNKFAYNKPSVLIPRKGSLGNAFYLETPFWNVDTIYYTEIDESKVIPKYIYYYIQNQHLDRLNIAGGVPSMTQATLKKLSIPVPTLEEQEKIVSILDKFDKLTSDISEGLTAEIELRRKQYEYYRNKLLSFEEMIVNE